MKITLNKINGMLEALKSLDGPEASRFKYGSKFTWNRAKDIKLFTKELEALNEEGQSIFNRGVAVQATPTPEEISEVNRQFAELQKNETEVPGVLRFNLTDLNLYDEVSNKKGNNIPATTLASIVDLIDDGTPPVEPTKSEEENDDGDKK